MAFPSLDQLPPRVVKADNLIHGVVETPKGSHNKLSYEPNLGTFKFNGVMPEGHSFPFDFGFVPSTKAEDGDQLDAMFSINSLVTKSLQ